MTGEPTIPGWVLVWTYRVSARSTLYAPTFYAVPAVMPMAHRRTVSADGGWRLQVYLPVDLAAAHSALAGASNLYPLTDLGRVGELCNLLGRARVGVLTRLGAGVLQRAAQAVTPGP